MIPNRRPRGGSATKMIAITSSVCNLTSDLLQESRWPFFILVGRSADGVC